MNLLEVYESIFLEVCTFNRLARKPNLDPGGQRLSYETVRTRFEELLAQAKASLKNDRVLEGQFDQVKAPVVFFIDDAIKSSRLPIAAEWAEKTLEEKEYSTVSGASSFWKQLSQTLKTPGRDADDRLGVLCTCLGLGFKGVPDNPAAAQADVQQMQTRLMANLQDGPICPQAYFANREILHKKPTRWVSWVVAGFIVVAVSSLVFYFVLFYFAKQDLSRTLNGIIKAPPSLTANP